MAALDDARVRRYLLGQMPEDEAEAFEGEYFASGEALEQVWGVEHDLVDAYVAGELGTEERAVFESHYLASPLHRDRVAAARALRAATAGPAERPPSRRAVARPPWLALAAGLLLALGAWWLKARPQPPAVVARVTPAAASVPTPATESSTTAPSDAPRPVVAAFALSPVLLRGSQPTPVLRVARGTDEIAITLEGEAPAGVASGTRLLFDVTTVEGAPVTSGHVRAAADGLGVARIAAARVPPGDYILSVRSASSSEEGPLRQYFFRVLRP
jgi:hypothetical protein